MLNYQYKGCHSFREWLRDLTSFFEIQNQDNYQKMYDLEYNPDIWAVAG
jgi:hypothetical protein